MRVGQTPAHTRAHTHNQLHREKSLHSKKAPTNEDIFSTQYAVRRERERESARAGCLVQVSYCALNTHTHTQRDKEIAVGGSHTQKHNPPRPSQRLRNQPTTHPPRIQPRMHLGSNHLGANDHHMQHTVRPTFTSLGGQHTHHAREITHLASSVNLPSCIQLVDNRGARLPRSVKVSEAMCALCES